MTSRPLVQTCFLPRLSSSVPSENVKIACDGSNGSPCVFMPGFHNDLSEVVGLRTRCVCGRDAG